MVRSKRRNRPKIDLVRRDFGICPPEALYRVQRTGPLSEKCRIRHFSDNGGEFINYHLYEYCTKNNIAFTRSRAYRKNDNCFVEQKNNSVVRRYAGYFRYDTEQQLELVNEIYD